MTTIEEIEPDLEAHRLAVLMRLREENWRVVEVHDGIDWANEQSWVVESETRGKGTRLILWFYLYAGSHDGCDNVILSHPIEKQPSPYGGDVSIQFNGRKFEKQLDEFMVELVERRCKAQ